MSVQTFALETRYELLKTFRMPAFVLPTLAFPWMFYILFGLAFKAPGAALSMPTYLLATYGVFGVMGVALFGFGVTTATERGQGWLRLKRASPMPPAASTFAKTVMATVFGTLVYLGLALLAAGGGDVSLGAGNWLLLGGVLIGAMLPFVALGLTFGYLCGPHAAPAVINLIYLPMAFLSGLWMPIKILPGFIQKIATFLPSYYAAQLALGVVGMPMRETAVRSVLALAAFAAVFLTTAWLAQRRDRSRS
ncbi:MAG: ABC transporter permease [Acidobacteriota bacterium]